MHWNDLKFCHLFTIISCKYTNSEYREIQPYHFVSTIRIIWCAWKLLKLSKTDVKKLGFGESELLSSHKLQVYNIIFFGHFANFNDSIIFLLVNFFRKFLSEYEQFAWFVQFKQHYCSVVFAFLLCEESYVIIFSLLDLPSCEYECEYLLEVYNKTTKKTREFF